MTAAIDRHVSAKLTLADYLADQFYSWEIRGRGWQIWDYAVGLEPPFEPFSRRHAPSHPIIDDARQPGLIQSLFKNTTQITAASAIRTRNDRTTIQADLAVSSGDPVETQLALPPKLKITPAAAEQFLLSLACCKFPVVLEVVGLAQSVIIQFACARGDQPALEQQVTAFFPEAVLLTPHASLSKHWGTSGGHAVIVDFGLENEFCRPLAAASSFEPDPLTAIVGALTRLKDPEVALLQILFQATRHPWAEHMIRAVTDDDGRAFFTDAPETLTLARQKVARPLFAAVVRVAAKAAAEQRAWKMVRAVGGAFNQLSRPASNQLIPLSNDGLDQSVREADLINRQTHRSGMILNSEELVSLVHLPSASLRSEKLVRDSRKKRPAPSLALGHELILGENQYRSRRTRVTLSAEQRIKHTHIIGVSGTGKSTLVLQMALQDIKNGRGVGVLDPHGDLIDKILGEIPDGRHGDVILFDPSDEEFPIGFNILSAHSELEKNLLASDLVAVFRRLSTSWGDQMTSVLGNAVLAFLESERGGTLADLKRFLVEADYRQEFLATVSDPETVYYWTKEFPLLAGKPQAPLLTRLDTFLRPRPIRNMVTQKESRLDFREIMNGKKILLAKLAQGAIGEQNSYLLGTLLVSKLHQLAIARQEVAESERPNFYLYIDEFQNFITPSMASILSGARKYHLALCLAHQEFRQMWSQDKEVASAVISNPYTRICFRLGDFDAKRLQHGFSTFEASDLQNLSVGEAIARIERNEYDFNLRTLPLTTTDDATAKQRRERIVSLSRQRYAQARHEVERQNRISRDVATTTKVSLPRQTVTGPKFLPPVLPAAKPRDEAPVVTIPPSIPLGRGGHEHKYLQQLIKRLADDHGFCVTIEQPVLGSTGSVDVALEKGSRRIACEISITSTPEYELKNIEKCLAGGFNPILVLAGNKRQLARIKKLAHATLLGDSLERIVFIRPDELPSLLQHYAQEDPTTEETVKGYKVKVKRRAITGDDAEIRRVAISRVLLKSLKRLRQDDGDENK